MVGTTLEINPIKQSCDHYKGTTFCILKLISPLKEDSVLLYLHFRMVKVLSGMNIVKKRRGETAFNGHGSG